MVILVFFNSFNVVKNLKKPDLLARQKPPFYTTQNGMQRYTQYAMVMKKKQPKQFNDFSNIALATRVDIVARKLCYSKCRSNGHLFWQCSPCDMQFKARIKHKLAIKIVIMHSIPTNEPTIQAKKE